MFFGFELLADIKYAFIVRRGILDPARIAAALPSADRRALRGRRRPRLDHVVKVDGKEIANHPSHTIPFLLTFDEIATAHAQQTTGTPGSPSATARSVPSECARVQPEFMTDDQGYGIPSRQERSRARRRIKKAMQADTLQELIAWLRANPDKASQGTAGAGSTSHLSGIFFQMETGTRYQFVPYRNTGMQDLMADLIDLMIDPAGFLCRKFEAGTIKAYAVTRSHRTPAAPDVPTVEEAGLPALQITSWHGLLGAERYTKGHHR